MIVDDGIIYPDWAYKKNNIICGFTLPVYGNFALTRKSISRKTTKENKTDLANKLGLEAERIFSPHQVHKDGIIFVDKDKIGLGAFDITGALEADACVTDIKKVLLITTWADCIPVILYDEENDLTACVHSGWKSAALDIAGKTIDIFLEKGCRPDRIYAAVGPGIRGCCYEVAGDFAERFEGTHNDGCFEKRDGKTFFDLAGSVLQRLLSKGLSGERIDFYGRCNCCSKDPVFFSNRKDKDAFEGQAAFTALL